MATDRITITNEIRAKLKAEKERTGLHGRALLAKSPTSVPKGLSSRVIDRLISGETTTALPAHIDWLLELFATSPDDARRIPPKREMIEQIKSERTRTGVSLARLIHQTKRPQPDGLTLHIVESWLSMDIKTVRPEHFGWVIAAYLAYPNRAPEIDLTHAHLTRLREAIERTGQGPRAILRGKNANRPAGLSSTVIFAWLAGRTQSAKKGHWEWLMARYASWRPDPTRIEITPDIRLKLADEKKRTGITPARLLTRHKHDVPDGLTSSMVDAWVRGQTEFAIDGHIEFVLNRYDELSGGGHRLPLTVERIGELQRELDRTGRGVADVLRLAPKPLPKGLNNSLISQWLRGKVATAKHQQWDCIMNVLNRLPDKRV